jgi:secernin
VFWSFALLRTKPNLSLGVRATSCIHNHGITMCCDTFVAFPPTAPNGMVVFGKNSDRPTGEGQSITRYPARQYKEHSKVKCTYLDIPQAASTYAVLLSQIDWMWGAEMGANECGVVIGNEAVWTKVPEETEKLLLGMDLV